MSDNKPTAANTPSISIEKYKWFDVKYASVDNHMIGLKVLSQTQVNGLVPVLHPVLDNVILFLTAVGFKPVMCDILFADTSLLINASTGIRGGVGGFALNNMIVVDPRIHLLNLPGIIIHELLHVWFFRVSTDTRTQLEKKLTEFKDLLFKDRKDYVDIQFNEVTYRFSTIVNSALTRNVKRLSDIEYYARKKYIIRYIIDAMKTASQLIKSKNIPSVSVDIKTYNIVAIEILSVLDYTDRRQILSIPMLVKSVINSASSKIRLNTTSNEFPFTTSFLKKIYFSLNNNLVLSSLPTEVMYEYMKNTGRTGKVSPYGLTNVDELWVDMVMNYHNLGGKYKSLIKEIILKYK